MLQVISYHICNNLKPCWHNIPILFCLAPDRPEISVSPTLFSDGYLLWRELDTYRVTLVAVLPDGSKGQADIIVHVNDYPSGGTCDISPKDGYNLDTVFTVTCTNWTDPQGIQQYQFYGKI